MSSAETKRAAVELRRTISATLEGSPEEIEDGWSGALSQLAALFERS